MMLQSTSLVSLDLLWKQQVMFSCAQMCVKSGWRRSVWRQRGASGFHFLRLAGQATKALLSPLQRAEKILAAKSREDRAEAVSAKRTYGKSFTEKLVKWIGAKFVTAEVVSNISELEAEVRCKLTWQEFDSCLWLCSLSAASELAEAGVVADPVEFVAQRKHLVVGFSDQVPLWAKAPGRKAVASSPGAKVPLVSRWRGGRAAASASSSARLAVDRALRAAASNASHSPRSYRSTRSSKRGACAA